MGSRPVFHKDLKEYFASLREAAGIGSQRQAADLIRRRGFANIHDGTLNWIESGRTKNPDPAILRGMAAVYKVPYQQIVSAFVTRGYGIEPTVTRPDTGSGVQEAPSPKGDSSDAGTQAATLQRLQEDVKFYRATIKRARDLLRRADTLLSAETRTTPRAKPSSRGSRRRAH